MATQSDVMGPFVVIFSRCRLSLVRRPITLAKVQTSAHIEKHAKESKACAVHGDVPMARSLRSATPLDSRYPVLDVCRNRNPILRACLDDSDPRPARSGDGILPSS